MTKERLQMSIQTAKDTISILEKQEPEDAGHYLQLEHEKFVLSALEKQIPKKTVKGKIITGNDYCPICHYFVQPPCDKYCPHCGQALLMGDNTE